jgi:hypothetical protein
VDKELMEQLQELIDSLRVAEAQAQQVAETLRERRLDLGPEHNHHADKIMDLIRKAEQLRLLAEKGEGERQP